MESGLSSPAFKCSSDHPLYSKVLSVYQMTPKGTSLLLPLLTQFSTKSKLVPIGGRGLRWRGGRHGSFLRGEYENIPLFQIVWLLFGIFDGGGLFQGL